MVRIFMYLLSFLFGVHCWGQSPSEVPYFEQLYTEINAAIEAGEFEHNLRARDRFMQDPAFAALNCYQKGKIFHKIGVSYYLLDREKEAIACFRDEVLTNWQDCTEVPDTERANTIYNIGISYQYLGEIKQAKRYLNEALYIFENAPDYPPHLLAKKFHGVAKFYLNNYNPFRAKLYFENALNIYRQIEGSELDRFDIMNNFLIMSIDSRKHEEAGAYFAAAMALHEEAEDDVDDYDLSLLYQNAAIAHFELGELELAMEKSVTTLELIDSTAYPTLYSNALEKIAMINGEMGQFDRAIEGLQEVVQLRKQHLDNADSYLHLSYAYENICEILMKKGAWQQAKVHLQKAIKALILQGAYEDDGSPIISQSLAIKDLDLIRLLSLQSKLHVAAFEQNRDQVILEKALHLHAKIDTLINQQLLTLQFEGSKLDFISLVQEYYGRAIVDALKGYELTEDQKYLHQAYLYSSKTKAIILQNKLKEEDAFSLVASPEKIVQEKELVQRMFDIQEQLNTDLTTRDSLIRAYVEAQRELETFVRRMEKEEPAYYQSKYAFFKPPEVKAIQASLPEGLAVVEYFYTDHTIFSFWLTRHHFVLVPIDNDETLKTSLSSFADQCRNPGTPVSRSLGYALYQKLVAAGLPEVQKEITRLCLIPDGPLHTLSFEALNSSPERNRWLIEDYGISYSYSIGLAVSRVENPSFEIPYLGFGTAYTPNISGKLKSRRLLFGEENLTQLNLSEKEIHQASALFSGISLLGQEATLDNFFKYSPKARILHLSLHGLVDFEDPLSSSILFDDHQQSFLLYASDLYSHKINSDLVILSACHSADGKVYNGEGVQGMSKAFMVSGVKNILSSLWSASEVSSSKMVNSFLRNVQKGIPNDLALHQAKLDYLSNARPSQRHPFYWANFIMIGEVADHPSSLSPSPEWFVGAFLVFICLFFFRKVK